GDDRRTAELASQLEQVHRERGDSRAADRFGELRRRYQRAAGLSDEDLAAAAPPPPAPASAELEEMPIAEIEALPVAPASAAPPPPRKPEAPEVTASQPVHEKAAHEVDLSDEWTSLLEAKADAGGSTPTAAPPSAPEEFSGAQDAVEFEISADAEPEPAAQQPVGSAQEAPEAPGAAICLAESFASASPAPPPPPTPPAPTPPSKPASAAAEPEFELDQDYALLIEPEALVPAHEQRPPQAPPAPQPEPVAQNTAPAAPSGGFASDQFLADL